MIGVLSGLLLVPCAALQASLPTPVGPFCPFRSDFCAGDAVDAKMAELSEMAPELSRRMAALTLDMQMGTPPKPETIGSVAKDMRRARDVHREVTSRLTGSVDFQAREYAALTAAALERRGGDERLLEKIIDLQIEGIQSVMVHTKEPTPAEAH